MEKTAWIKIKKAAWPITAAVLAIALIGALAWGRSAANGRAATQANLEHLYQSAFDGLDNGLRTISTDLSKLRVATSSAQQTVLLSAVWREAAQVQEAAGLLPLNTRTSNALLRFINQTGDYCYMLCKRVQAGQGIGEEQYKTLLTLEEQSGAVADELDGMREENVD
ncbi:MAG: germination protein YpeB, partial [Clostridia bacterium]|nr:germination protein YpeB [Clostridia bacterium]